MPHRQSVKLTAKARDLRARQTKAESLLWYALRARRLCGLKFRRQYPIEPFIADFASVEKKLIVEIDGGYHDWTHDDEISRQNKLEAEGWNVIRFTNEDVLGDVEVIAMAIAQQLQVKPEFHQRHPT